MNIANIIIKGLALRARTFEEATKDPIFAQEKVLLKYIGRNRNAEYGKKYKFASIRSIEDFRRTVPLVSYSSILPYIERMKDGAGNVLTADKIIFFGITSGTTGKPKFIPVTKRSLRSKDDITDLWAYYTYKDHPGIFNGKILAIVSPEIKNRTGAGIPYGPEDGHAYNNMPNIIKRLYSLPYELFYIDDYDARYYCMLRIAMEQNVSIIATLNPSTLVIMCSRIEDLKDRLIEDISRGTLNANFNIRPDIRKKIERALKPNPRRAAELAGLLQTHGRLLPRYFWPKLELIECWKGGTVKVYLKDLLQYFGEVAVRDFGCLSTESRSSIPISDEGSGGVLAVNSNFYEFIPKEDIDLKSKRSFLCNELEKGREYLLVVTTAAGLYRYEMDDVIRVSGFFNKTPVIEFVQKGHNSVSITGEKVYESHIVEALRRASERSKIGLISYCAYAEAANILRYVFLVELEGLLSKDDKERLLASIDEELRQENSEYDDLRKQQLIKVPSLKIIAPGEFEKYRRKQVAGGAHDTQFKMPRLLSSADIVKEFTITEEVNITERYYR